MNRGTLFCNHQEMPALFRTIPLHVFILSGLLAVGSRTGMATAQEKSVQPFEPAVAVAPLCLEQLLRMNCDQLEQLYLQAEPGPIPDGYLRGKAMKWAGTCLAVPMSRATGVLWHGKIFKCSEGTLTNKWCGGIQAIDAQVCYGPSWKDGKQSIIMDYSQTSRVWSKVRDEIRQVSPGLYLGVMYHRACPEPKFKMYFAIQAEPTWACAVP